MKHCVHIISVNHWTYARHGDILSRVKSVHLSIYVSRVAYAELVSRAETATRAAGVPIKPTSLAAALLHGALGLRPDGTPLADENPKLDASREDETPKGEALKKAVAALAAFAARMSAEQRRERVQKVWIPDLMQKTGASASEVVAALKADRRRLSLRYGDLGLKSPKPGLLKYHAKRKPG